MAEGLSHHGGGLAPVVVLPAPLVARRGVPSVGRVAPAAERAVQSTRGVRHVGTCSRLVLPATAASVVVLWIAALVGSFALAGAFGGEYRQDYLQPGSESKAASDTLKEKFPQQSGDTVQIVVHAEAGVAAPEVQRAGQKIFDDVAANAHVLDVVSPYSRGGGEPDLRRTAGPPTPRSTLDKTVNEYTPRRRKELVEPVLEAGDDTLRVEVGGAVARLSQTLAVGSEGIGLLAAAIILLVTFGSAVAMGLPLVTALFGLGVAVVLGEVLRRVVDVPDWAPAGRRHGRARGRDRLRPAHRHAVPQQPRRRSGATVGDR